MKKWKRLLSATMVLLFIPTIIVGLNASVGEANKRDVKFRLTVLHNNDGESQLINAGSGLEDFGGIARFATQVRKLRIRALVGPPVVDGYRIKRPAILLSSGDNFLSGPEFSASLAKGIPFYDTIALDKIGYDAFAIGNHELDFGPDVLADFIEGFRRFRSGPFLSANLDYSNEPVLQTFVDRGKIAKSRVLFRKVRWIGVVGATTADLRFISSPRDVIVNQVQPAVQAEVNALEASGVNIIILISHLQSVNEDIALLSQLKGVDIAIAGGGDEVLANADDLLVPGDTSVGPYPIVAAGADGVEVPVVTTAGNYKYVGRLIVDFDRDGQVIGWDEHSGPVRVAGGNNPDAVNPNRFIQKKVVDPVAMAVAELDQNVIGSSNVALDGRRSQVRTVETNEGNLIADALFWQATQLAADFGVQAPDVSLQNGGGIRNDDFRGPGDLTELDTFDILPFSNFVTIIPDIPREQFKEIMENAVSRVEDVSGRFAQVSGFTMVWDPNGTTQVLDADCNVDVVGSRVLEIQLADGTPIVTGGVVVDSSALNIATIDFLARSGDQYPYRGAPFTSVGVTYQQALANYISDGLGGSITAADYPEGGEGRITEQ
jgi:5'-nucleotidase